jgi:tetratricopeptide (TPR) repeat protein
MSAAEPAAAVIHLKRGMPAPVITLPDLAGETVRTDELTERTLVLIFGELYHAKTLAACADIRTVIESDKLAGRPVTPLLIVAQDAPTAALAARAADAGFEMRILHDAARRNFGEYRVAVIPSVVVVDRDGRVVHAQAGYLERFKDIATDAVMLSEGLLSAEEFEASLHPADVSRMSQEQTRAGRLTNLARQLVRRGLPEVAEEKYFEALEIMPSYLPARLGLGFLRLRRGHLAEAELEFRTVLAIEPKSLDGRLGLAYVQVLRAGDELAEAETTVRGILASNPGEARAHYLMGLVHERRDELDKAAASFRRAAEALMSQRGTWVVRKGGSG